MKHRLGWSRRKWSVSFSWERFGTSFAMIHLNVRKSARSEINQKEDTDTKNRKLVVMGFMSG